MFPIVSEETYKEGQVIFNEGSAGDWIYVIISGSVEIAKSIGGKKVLIDVLGQGEIFGELGYLAGIKRTTTARAVSPTTLGLIDRDFMDQEFNSLSSELRAIIVTLLKRFKNMTDSGCELSSRSDARVRKTLSLTYKDGKSFVKAFTNDISTGGLCIRTKNPLPTGEDFLLKLQLPGLPTPLEIGCEVAWVKASPTDSPDTPGQMGVRFTQGSKKDLDILQNYVRTVKLSIS